MYCNFEGYDSGCKIEFECNTFGSPTSDSRIYFTSSTNYNGAVVFPDTVTNLYRAFAECPNYNALVNIPNNVRDCGGMFVNCIRYNRPVNIPLGVTNCTSMFINCYNFNKPVVIANSVRVMPDMFRNCRNFNQSVTVPESLISFPERAFMDCHKFNSPVIFECNNTYNGGSYGNDATFYNCTIFNQPLNIQSNSLTYSRYMLYNCRNFNSAIHIGDNQGDLSYMLSYDTLRGYNFGGSVTLGNNIKSIAYMFNGQYNFNGEVILGNNIQNMQRAFYSCTQFSHPVQLGEGSTDCKEMFWGCKNFSYPLHVPDGANCYLIISATNYNSTISVTNLPAMSGGTPSFPWLPDYRYLHSKFEFHESAIYDNAYIGATVIIRDEGEIATYVKYSEYYEDGNETYTYCGMNSYAEASASYYGCEIRILEGGHVNLENDPPHFEDNSYNQTPDLSGVNNCTFYFKGCKSLNQAIIVPNTAKTCVGMFVDCESLNQPVVFED